MNGPGPLTLVTATVTAVAVDPDGPLAGLALMGAPGVGKTAFSLALVHGCPWQRTCFVADDGAALTSLGGRVVASAPAAMAGQVEIRGAGIHTLPASRRQVALRLAVTLHPAGAWREPDWGTWRPLGDHRPGVVATALPTDFASPAGLRQLLRSVLAGQSGQSGVTCETNPSGMRR